MENQPTVEDFLSDSPPERIIGTECEYSIQAVEKLSGFLSPEQREKIGLASIGSWSSNGARIYGELGQLEYAAPESLGPRDAVISDFAGILVMKKLVENSDVYNRGLHRITGSFYEPNGTSSTTRGYHENYLMPNARAKSYLFKTVMPSFLASRVWAGQGTLLPHGYVLSQKVWDIGDAEIVGSTSNRRTFAKRKPMIMYVNEDQSVEKNWCRVELRYADGGMSPHVRLASLGAASLVMRLIEHPRFLPTGVVLNKVAVRNPEHAAKIYARDLTLKNTFYSESGRNISALDIQESLIEVCDDMAADIKLPKDELTALDIWRDIISRLRTANLPEGDYAGLEKITDNVALLYYLRRLAEHNDMNVRNMKALEATLKWDMLLPKDGGAVRWWRLFSSPHIPNNEVETRVKQPPNTRAARRGRLVRERKLSNSNWGVSTLKSGDWQYLGGPY